MNSSAIVRVFCVCVLGSFANARQNVVHESQILAPTAYPSEFDFAASVDLDGATLIVGAPGLVDRNVLVHDWDGNFFNETIRLDPNVGTGAFPGIGRSVDLDGDTLAIGAPGDDLNTTNSGSVHLFVRVAGVWSLQQELREPPVGNAQSYLGRSVALAGDTLVVGGPMISDLSSGFGNGRVIVYSRSAGVWNSTATLTASDGASGDGFGFSVDIDADRIVVGAPHSGLGAFYVFERSASTWTEVAKRSGGGEFATDVRLVGDTIMARSKAGAVSVWRGGGALWSQELLSPPVNTSAGAIDLEADSLVVAFTGVAPFARHFQRSAQSWTADVDFVPSQPVPPFHEFGKSVTLEGPDVIVGAPKVWNSSQSDAGYAYFFRSNVSGPVGTPYCSGNETGFTCPCNNTPAPSAIEGCVNSTGRGAHLAGQGSSSIARHDFMLTADGLVPNKPSMAIVAPGTNAPQPFHDGRLCLEGAIKRLATVSGNSSGTATWGPNFVNPPWTAGDVRYFQVVYRDVQHGSCTSRVNISNALIVQFVP